MTERTISFAELHALVEAWLPDQTFFVGVLVHHSNERGGRRNIITWSISHSFTTDDCERIEAPTAAEAYDKLRAAVPASQSPLATVGHVR